MVLSESFGMKKLLGIGGSEDSLLALEHTVERVSEMGDDLTVAIFENPESDLSPDDIEQRVTDILMDYDMDPDVRRLSGHPASRIVDIAERENFDEIVLGGGEESPMGKIRVGEIAEFVILNSHVSVKLVR